MHVAASCEQNWFQCGPFRGFETRARRKGRLGLIALGKGVQKSASTNEAEESEESGRPMSAEARCFGSKESREKLGEESWGCDCSCRQPKVAEILGRQYFRDPLAMTTHFRLQSRMSVQDVSKIPSIALLSQS